MRYTPRFISLAAAACLSLIAGNALRADSVMVSENGVGANETVWISSSNLGSDLHVYAGVLNLSVDGVATSGFCIDPWHWSSGSALSYNLESLDNAPKSANNTTPNPMGASTALQIEQLWQQYYTPGISNVNAAALQIKIWELVDLAVDNGTFSLLSIDGGDSAAVTAAINGMSTFLSQNPGAASANLVAVTGAGQDYVIPSVPDSGATVILLGVALLGVGLAQTKFRLFPQA
ncbi:MAG TPA: hypothetical protein VGM64_13490 [Lacunisphaera sp.]|jgi:hypothetical protein